MSENLNLDEKKIEQLTLNVAKLANGVTTVAHLKGISRAELEAVYNVGNTYYATSKYAEAGKIFEFLCLFDHTNAKYWTANGAVRQAQKNFKGAYECYVAAALYDIEKPKPHFYAAQCALALGSLDHAESGCRTLLHYCKAGTAENDRFRAKAEALLAKVLEAKAAKSA